ncbi:MAG TPA: hypothetical protein PK655_02350 [archaeon]|nr:hypothetical protein [archaeon]
MENIKKKEDQEYIDSVLEKENVSTKHNTDFYKKLDSSFLIGSLFVSVLYVITVFLFPIAGVFNNHVINFIFTATFIFAVSYIVFYLLFWVVGLFFKKIRNYKFNFIAKLVISIILAIIITNMMTVIACRSTPTKATRMLIKDQINNLGAEGCTDPILFTKSRSTLIEEGITITTGLGPEQVYFINPENIPNFDTKDNILKYGASSSKRVMMCVLCDNGKTGLEKALQAHDINTTINSTTDEKILCAVYPRKTSTN